MKWTYRILATLVSYDRNMPGEGRPANTKVLSPDDAPALDDYATVLDGFSGEFHASVDASLEDRRLILQKQLNRLMPANMGLEDASLLANDSIPVGPLWISRPGSTYLHVVHDGYSLYTPAPSLHLEAEVRLRASLE